MMLLLYVTTIMLTVPSLLSVLILIVSFESLVDVHCCCVSFLLQAQRYDLIVVHAVH
jgi:hypothetical protein